MQGQEERREETTIQHLPAKSGDVVINVEEETTTISTSNEHMPAQSGDVVINVGSE